MKRLFSNGVGRFAPSALPHYYVDQPLSYTGGSKSNGQMFLGAYVTPIVFATLSSGRAKPKRFS